MHLGPKPDPIRAEIPPREEQIREELDSVLASHEFRSSKRSQIPKSRPVAPNSVSFLLLSWFEWRRISNGSNSSVCNAPSVPGGPLDQHPHQPALLAGGLLLK